MPIKVRCCGFLRCQNYFRTNGGNNLLLTSPKPIRTSAFLHQPLIQTVSLSLMNLRSLPSFILIGFLPLQVSSSIEPKLSGVGPEIVPDPIISPELTRHPLEVWCANCWLMVQYMYLKLEF